jgi:hypothetical protein
MNEQYILLTVLIGVDNPTLESCVSCEVEHNLLIVAIKIMDKRQLGEDLPRIRHLVQY